MKSALVIAGILLCVFVAEAMEIKTIDGKVYANAKVMNVTPYGLDISYTNPAGETVIKGLSFNQLPEKIRKEYGYKHQDAVRFSKQVKQYSGKKFNKVISDHQQQLSDTKHKLKDQFSLGGISLTPKELDSLIYANRIGAKIKVISTTKRGVVAQIEKVYSGKQPTSRLIFIETLTVKTGGEWQGFIYPTGVNADVQDHTKVPVYTPNREQATHILAEYLDMHSHYNVYGNSISQTEKTTKPAPATKDKIQLEGDDDSDDDNGDGDSGYDDDHYDNNYYFNQPYPAWYIIWYRRHHRHHHRHHHHHHHHRPHPRPHPHHRKTSTVTKPGTQPRQHQKQHYRRLGPTHYHHRPSTIHQDRIMHMPSGIRHSHPEGRRR